MSANNILKDEKTATIHLHKNLADQNKFRKEIRKYHLAHEWLEVMYVFCNKERHPFSRSKKVDKRINETVLYYLLTENTIWQDTPEEFKDIHKALKPLLVSKHSIMVLLEEFGTSLPELSELINKDVNEASSFLRKVAIAFAAQKSVSFDIVMQRLLEILMS